MENQMFERDFDYVSLHMIEKEVQGDDRQRAFLYANIINAKSSERILASNDPVESIRKALSSMDEFSGINGYPTLTFRMFHPQTGETWIKEYTKKTTESEDDFIHRMAGDGVIDFISSNLSEINCSSEVIPGYIVPFTKKYIASKLLPDGAKEKMDAYNHLMQSRMSDLSEYREVNNELKHLGAKDAPRIPDVRIPAPTIDYLPNSSLISPQFQAKDSHSDSVMNFIPCKLSFHPNGYVQDISITNENNPICTHETLKTKHISPAVIPSIVTTPSYSTSGLMSAPLSGSWWFGVRAIPSWARLPRNKDLRQKPS